MLVLVVFSIWYFVIAGVLRDKQKVELVINHADLWKHYLDLKQNIHTGFHHVDNYNSSFVYSAFMDTRGNRIRIIGIADVGMTDSPIGCILWYPDRFVIQAVRGFVANINEGHDKQYSAVYFVCNLDMENLEQPTLVSVVPVIKNAIYETPRNLLKVEKSSLSKRVTLTACVPPIHSFYSDHEQVVEWVELNKVMGVQYFNFYVNNISTPVEQRLKHYVHERLARVLYWKLPISQNEIHYFGQLAAINDCLYRSKLESDWTQFVDLDEFVVYQRDTPLLLPQLLDELSIHNASVYAFRHAHFKIRSTNPDWMEIQLAMNITVKSKAFATKLMNQYINPVFDRSKCIVRPKDIVTMGIHEAWAMKNIAKVYAVDKSIALLHHYRTTISDFSEILVVNNAILKYGP
ncbi:uncharacterized protein LOC127860800 isoform X3 [Dreissena polymorpha]|uniref:uncharacterized protein LOC127860800 isoform X3 n=1 Tax=Dreissena polymorpha TaxID=45954 RepID=UPI002264C10A|nr:uncharacterized protein LOC127860800 isoform X3 [Dreissena polymorpha]